MKLTVIRRFRGPLYTIGTLYVNGAVFSDTMEDPDRGLRSDMTPAALAAGKKYGDTAIPLGEYEIDMASVSGKFKDRYWAKPYGGKIPRLKNVPAFDGVLIHPGNTQADTLGCILPGENKVKGKVVNSAMAFYRLMDTHLLPAYRRGEKITIEIRHK